VFAGAIAADVRGADVEDDDVVSDAGD